MSNYYLPVFASNYPIDRVPKAILWFFDSRGGNYFQQWDEDGNGVPQPGWVDEAVCFLSPFTENWRVERWS